MEQNQKKRLYEALGSNLKQARVQLSLTQQQLADKIDLTRTSIVNIEQGRQNPPLHILLDLADALHVSLIELIPSREEFGASPKLDERNLESVSQKDIEKLESFLKKFTQTTRNNE